jgi:hypothetical protein
VVVTLHQRRLFYAIASSQVKGDRFGIDDSMMFM